MSEPINPYAAPASNVDAGEQGTGVPLRGSYWTGGVITFVIMLLTLITLDGGELYQSASWALPAYAVAVFMAHQRDLKRKATRLDRVLVRWGFPMALIVMHIARVSPLGGTLRALF